MLYFASGVVIIVLCLVGILFKKDKVRQGLFIAILIAIAVPFVLSDFISKQDSVKYFKCTRCGEIYTATKDEYKYDAAHQSYYIEHDCSRYVPNINIYEIDKKDAKKELELKDNSVIK